MDTHHAVEEDGYRGIRIGDHLIVKQGSSLGKWEYPYVICEAIVGMTIQDLHDLSRDLKAAEAFVKLWAKERTGKPVEAAAGEG